MQDNNRDMAVARPLPLNCSYRISVIVSDISRCNLITDIIRQMAQRGISVLITDHNAREIFSVVDRSYLVQAGTVMAQGSVQDLVNDPKVRQNYLGEQFTL